MNLGIAPNQLPHAERTALQLIRPPKWLGPDDEERMRKILSSEDELKATGVLALGCVLRANSLMWHPGGDAHGGEVVFTADPDAQPSSLFETSAQIQATGKEGYVPRNPQEARLSQHMNDDYSHLEGAPVSSTLTPLQHVFVSTTLFDRRHLPMGQLQGSVYPILVAPQSLMVAILPFMYWSDEARALFEKFV